MHIAIIGNGKMGRAAAAIAEERGHTIQTLIRRAENADGQALTAERLRGVDVAVEFTRPDCVVRNLERLSGRAPPGKSVVSGAAGRPAPRGKLCGGSSSFSPRRPGDGAGFPRPFGVQRLDRGRASSVQTGCTFRHSPSVAEPASG